MRPIKLDTAKLHLTRFEFKVKALKLVQTHFPDELQEWDEGDVKNVDWWTVMATFLNLVEGADWFEIDWSNDGAYAPDAGVLDWLYEDWQQTMEEGAAEFNLAEYLEGVPVRCFSLTWQDLEDDYDYGFATLAGLVSDDVRINYSDLIGYGLWDNLDGRMKCELREGLEQGDFSSLPEPLCFLPEMARIATRSTGNIILDTSLGPGEWDPTHFTWAEDIERLKAAWQEAKPAVERLRAFKSWLRDDEENVNLMVRLVLNGGPINEEDENDDQENEDDYYGPERDE